eukprot:4060285-Amphidinium_carterae.1
MQKASSIPVPTDSTFLLAQGVFANPVCPAQSSSWSGVSQANAGLRDLSYAGPLTQAVSTCGALTPCPTEVSITPSSSVPSA